MSSWIWSSLPDTESSSACLSGGKSVSTRSPEGPPRDAAASANASIPPLAPSSFPLELPRAVRVRHFHLRWSAPSGHD